MSMISSKIGSLLKFGSSAYMLLIGVSIIITIVVLSIIAPFICPYSPTQRVGPAFSPPSSTFILGTNSIGHDVFSRLLHGGRTVLYVAIISTLMSMSIGIPLGMISGYIGGWPDRFLAVIMDAIYSFPGIILAIAIAAMLGPGNIFNIAIAIAVTYIPTYYRMVRGQVLSIKSTPMVEAAIAIGAPVRVILLEYIFPYVVPVIVVIFSMNIADAILTEAGLSYLGFGVTPPTPDWGYDLRSGQPYIVNAWWISTFPGLMITIAVVGFSMLAESLNELLSPKLRG